MHFRTISFLSLIRQINALLVYQGYEAPVEVEPWLAKMFREIENNSGEVIWQ
jgi:hypothetical protein